MSKIEKTLLIILLFLTTSSLVSFLMSEINIINTDNVLNINYGNPEFFLVMLFVGIYPWRE